MKRITRSYLTVVIVALIGFISVLLSIAVNVATTFLPESWKPYTWIAWPAVFLLALMVIGLSAWHFKLSQPTYEDRLTQIATSKRRQLLKVVRTIWIDGYLKDSLYNLARIELNLKEGPDTIRRPFELIVQQPSQAPRLVATDQPMDFIFDELGQALLILGAPGAGKTTLLLELARDLLDRAEQDSNHPIPVIFHLSTSKDDFEDWLANELVERYRIQPPRLAKFWIDTEQILPLLDGLDEVAPERRAKCISVINEFRKRHGLVPTAVCSREADYSALPTRLESFASIVIQPLSRAQIAAYLERLGEPLAGAIAVLKDNQTLWELLDTPLMLSIAVAAYRGRPAAEVQALITQGVHLFAVYTEAMFRRRTKVTEYTPEQTIHWLTWLAHSLVREKSSIVYVDRMHDWYSLKGLFSPPPIFAKVIRVLPEGFFGQLYLGICVLSLGVISGAICGLGLGWIGGLDLTLGLIIGVAVGLLIVLGIRVIDDMSDFYWKHPRNYKISFLGCLVGLSIGGCVGGLAESLLSFVLNSTGTDLLGWLFGFSTIPILLLAVPLSVNPEAEDSDVLVFLLFGFFGSWPSALVFWIIGQPASQPGAGLVWGVIIGLAGGLHGGLWFTDSFSVCGDYLRHYILRFLLWRNDYAPWNCVRFLDHAVERIFMRKVGSGYIFIHRLMMEYFAME